MPADLQWRHHFRPQYVLIYGRRSEFEDNESLSRLRAPAQGTDEYHVTFDRLFPQRALSNCICIRKGPNFFEAVAVPPTLRLGPVHAREWSDIALKKEAVEACVWMEEERKQFLISRWPYWDEWSKAPKRGDVLGVSSFEEE